MEPRTPIEEILQRLTRMETRLVQLGDHTGINLRSKQRVVIHPGAPDGSGAWVEIDALDVSLSRIVTELEKAGIGPGRIPVAHRGLPVASINFKMDTYHAY